MNLIKAFTDLFSLRQDYLTSISGIENAIQSNVLKPEDKLSRLSIQIERAAGWSSWTEGMDWIELEVYATKKGVPLDTVQHLLELLKSLNTKQ